MHFSTCGKGQEIDVILFCNNDLIWIISFSRPNFSFDFCDQVRLRSQTCLLLQSQSKVSEKRETNCLTSR